MLVPAYLCLVVLPAIIRTVVDAFPTHHASLNKERLHFIKESVLPPPGWSIRGDAPRDSILTLHVYLPQVNYHLLEQALHEISDPNHARYGQHLSKHEVDALVSPSYESLMKVDKWLMSYGIDIDAVNRSSSQDAVILKIPVYQVEEMLQTVQLVVYNDILSSLTRFPRSTTYGSTI